MQRIVSVVIVVVVGMLSSYVFNQFFTEDKPEVKGQTHYSTQTLAARSGEEAQSQESPPQKNAAKGNQHRVFPPDFSPQARTPKQRKLRDYPGEQPVTMQLLAKMDEFSTSNEELILQLNAFEYAPYREVIGNDETGKRFVVASRKNTHDTLYLESSFNLMNDGSEEMAFLRFIVDKEKKSFQTVVEEYKKVYGDPDDLNEHIAKWDLSPFETGGGKLGVTGAYTGRILVILNEHEETLPKKTLPDGRTFDEKRVNGVLISIENEIH